MQRGAASGFGWTDAAWRESAVRWIHETLTRAGATATGEIEQPHVRPWSTVMKVDTDLGTIWFKACGPGSLHEVRLVEALHRWAGARVPAPLATDPERGWFMSFDAGRSLDEALAGDPDLRHWEEALVDYAVLQRDLAARAADLVAVGVPDCRPEVMPHHLGALLDHPDELMVGEPGGLTPEGCAALRRLLPTFSQWCRDLATSGVAPTVQHDDVHETNVFVRTGGHTFIDWADASVAHPFGSLIYPLRLASERFGVSETGPEVTRLRDAYLEPWTDRLGRDELTDLASMSMRVAAVGRALAWQRGTTAVEKGALKEYYATGTPRWLLQVLYPQSA